MISRRPVLVTGAVRSGTTWLAQMLALAPGTTLLGREPFNPHGRQYGLGGISRFSYSYFGDLNQPEAEKTYRRILSGRSPKTFGRLGARQLRFLLPGVKSRLIIKDPHACLAATWLGETFGIQAVAMVRHPCAQVASVKRMGWQPDPTQFLAQPQLMAEHLESLRPELEDPPTDLIGRAALTWKCVYSVLERQRHTSPIWLISHERFSAKPVEAFEALYGRLGLPWSAKVAADVQAATSPVNPVTAPEGVLHELRRDSVGNIDSWRRSLTAEEIDRVKAITRPVFDIFYSDDCPTV